VLKGHLGNDVYIKVPKRFIGGIDGCRVDAI
jgi:putative transposon-encoded protein